MLMLEKMNEGEYWKNKQTMDNNLSPEHYWIAVYIDNAS